MAKEEREEGSEGSIGDFIIIEDHKIGSSQHHRLDPPLPSLLRSMHIQHKKKKKTKRAEKNKETASAMTPEATSSSGVRDIAANI
ncbi:hypothetical protein SLEP1_g1259 [Rubroshorea leprosula]|uniref:Uncharacterized protein n=1 Tax=Rubroshorea leprosula TaxID=152421 RepID=A0AAV5HDA3_9ROSI|nr:hypothetical protein SLEP1_g1259 [Rubroshorea leprosula]